MKARRNRYSSKKLSGFVNEASHIKWVSWQHGISRLKIVDGGDGHQIIAKVQNM
jgi:hypothetical protein